MLNRMQRGAKSTTNKEALSRWATGAIILIGWAISSSGQRNQTTVDFLMAATAIWAFYVFWSSARIRRLLFPVRVGIGVIAFVVLATGWWLVARQILLVSPPAPSWAEQKRFAAEQNNLLEAQYKPIFRFVQGRRAVGNEVFESLEIWNDGAPLTSYKIWEGSYIQVDRNIAPLGRVPVYDTRYIPSIYLSRHDFNGDAKAGLLATYYAWRDQYPWLPLCNKTKEFERLEAEIRKRYNSQVSIRRRVFLEIYYVTRARASNKETFEIYPSDVGDNRPKVPRKRKVGFLRMTWDRDLKTITAENLFDNWNSESVLSPYKKLEILDDD